MLNFSQVIRLAFISLSFYSASILILSKSAVAGEPIIDRNCQHHERTQEVFKKIPPNHQATGWRTSSFEVNNQKYALQLLRFSNSTGVLCLVKPNTPQRQRLRGIPVIQDKLIEKIEKDNSKPANYIVTVRGEKTEDILRTVYRLNLTNPNQPKVTPILRVYKN
ncbi:MAG TPA: hypothetical protein VK184_13460 [Nostocaceae cyanobacterium]|nr:hypothetical protein [Nostocaceae cyanobacterium]